jgi:hypothetical protein
MATCSEELFGILTDDDLYLDCLMMKPARLTDARLTTLRVWVPRYPLNKASTVACARQEVKVDSEESTTAHLVFDLRGTGESDGSPRDKKFHIDLQSIRAWAQERFGEVKVIFMGLPNGHGTAMLLPIRPAVIVESYHFAAAGSGPTRSPILYLSTYGHFGQKDDALCLALAQTGRPVYGIDPLRYLLHASAVERLEPDDLAQDLATLCYSLPGPPLVIGQPVSAGLALLWASQVSTVRGVIAIGRAQPAFTPTHIFDQSKSHRFFLGRLVYRIAPRPVALVMHEGHPLGGDAGEMAALYEACGQPKRVEKTRQIDVDFLSSIMDWIEQADSQPAGGE